jgi:hypothetical protein
MIFLKVIKKRKMEIQAGIKKLKIKRMIIKKI